MTKKRKFYESIACCSCRGRGPKYEWYSYAVNEAIKVGWVLATVNYWSTFCAYDKYREPGQCGLSGYVCPECNSITVEEFYQIVSGMHNNKIYGYTNGGGCYNCTSIFDKGHKTVACGLCYREVDAKDLWDEYKAGYVVTGLCTTPTADVALCPSCRPKIAIKELLPVQQYWYIREQEYKNRRFPNQGYGNLSPKELVIK